MDQDKENIPGQAMAPNDVADWSLRVHDRVGLCDQRGDSGRAR